MRLHHVIPMVATLLAAASLVTGCAVSARLGNVDGERSGYVPSVPDEEPDRPQVRTVPERSPPVEATAPARNYY